MEPDDLVALGAATLGESGGHPMAPRIRPAWAGATAAGPAYTAACAPGDNLAIHVAVTLAPPGSVLVADASAEPERGYWGEVLATAALARRLAGLVIDGCVRDVDALQSHGWGTFSTGVALTGATKQKPCEVGGAVTVGGVTVATGDWVVGDADGVVVIRADELGAVAEAGRARAEAEQELFAHLRAGATTVELLGLDDSGVKRP
ncbi:MAG TPA: RraA family protein [Acidimicrobiales bacterium]|nr:RraA family protein [Acidimicrobiales bacterium]